MQHQQRSLDVPRLGHLCVHWCVDVSCQVLGAISFSLCIAGFLGNITIFRLLLASFVPYSGGLLVWLLQRPTPVGCNAHCHDCPHDVLAADWLPAVSPLCSPEPPQALHSRICTSSDFVACGSTYIPHNHDSRSRPISSSICHSFDDVFFYPRLALPVFSQLAGTRKEV
jgi:hypothetical protein